MNKFLVAFISLLVSISIFAAEGFSSLEEQMTGKEFSAAGLDKLSQSELDSLNAWIRARSLATLATRKSTAADSDNSGDDDQEEESEEEEQERTTITSNLVGKFSGWDGQTTFKLKNGQVWVQSDKDKFYTKEIRNPAVVIEPGMFGTWRLSIEGFDENCRVKRIQ
jgi:biotin carboxyl carrier protein